jgi:hypothetical protein
MRWPARFANSSFFRGMTEEADPTMPLIILFYFFFMFNKTLLEMAWYTFWAFTPPTTTTLFIMGMSSFPHCTLEAFGLGGYTTRKVNSLNPVWLC